LHPSSMVSLLVKNNYLYGVYIFLTLVYRLAWHIRRYLKAGHRSTLRRGSHNSGCMGFIGDDESCGWVGGVGSK